MDMNTYNLTVTSKLYKKDYRVRAVSLSEASKQARVKFVKEFKDFTDVKVSLQPSDLKNHIDEIFNAIMKA